MQQQKGLINKMARFARAIFASLSFCFWGLKSAHWGPLRREVLESCSPASKKNASLAFRLVSGRRVRVRRCWGVWPLTKGHFGRKFSCRRFRFRRWRQRLTLHTTSAYFFVAEGKGQGVRIAVGLTPVRNDKNSTIFYFADVELWEIGFWFWCLVISIACFNWLSL